MIYLIMPYIPKNVTSLFEILTNTQYFLGISLTFLRISVPVSKLLKLASYVVELPRRGGFCLLFLFFPSATFWTAFAGENPLIEV